MWYEYGLEIDDQTDILAGQEVSCTKLHFVWQTGVKITCM